MVAVTPRSIAFPAMGTTVSVLSPSPLPDGGIDAVRALFTFWERRLSRFRPDSDLSRVNRGAGLPVPAGPLCRAVVTQAIRAARATGGTFDPTLGARMRALGYPAGGASHSAAGPAHPPGAWRHIAVDDAAGTIALPSGVALDLGGIAKGMAVDAAAGLLTELGIEAALVNAGGDLAIAGDGDAVWPVALSDAGGAIVHVHAGGLATSSTSRRRWRHAGRERHHLLDPDSGLPAASGIRSATVAAATCAQAEVAAKTALVRGERRGLAMLERLCLPGLLTRDDGTSLGSTEWERVTS